jgi:hypothetical protein
VKRTPIAEALTLDARIRAAQIELQYADAQLRERWVVLGRAWRAASRRVALFALGAALLSWFVLPRGSVRAAGAALSRAAQTFARLGAAVPLRWASLWVPLLLRPRHRSP